MNWIKSQYPKIIMIETAIIVLLCLILFGIHRSGKSEVISQDVQVARETITLQEGVDLKGLNKEEAKKKGIITEDIQKDNKKEVLAFGKIENDLGSRYIFSVLDTTTGESEIRQKRAFAEKMGRNQIGIGYSAGSIGSGITVEYERTFGRVKELYGSFRVTGWKWDSGSRIEHANYDAQVTIFISGSF